MFLQSHSLQPIRSNVLMMGWSDDKNRTETFVKNLNLAHEIDMSLVVLLDRGLPELNKPLRIDIWWRGMQNGSLMLILAHLMTQTRTWKEADIRIMRVVASDLERYEADKELNKLVDNARMRAACNVIVAEQGFIDILHQESQDASVVFLGFQVPEVENAEKFHESYEKLLEKLPTTILVCSTGEADLFV